MTIAVIGVTQADMDRLMTKIDIQPNGCWLFNGFRTKGGYGQFAIKSKMRAAHRVSYEFKNGPFPLDLPIGDHICHDPATCVGVCIHRSCCNPDHIKPSTHAMNASRDRAKSNIRNAVAASNVAHRAVSHCPSGHGYTKANTYITKSGTRDCRECARLSSRARRARNKRAMEEDSSFRAAA